MLCKDVIDLIGTVFQELGVPLAPDKIFGPSQVITYLGIEIDSINFVIRLPQVKFVELMASLRYWKNRKKCIKKELLSLIGLLSFACKVVKCGRFFLRRLIDLSTTVHSLYHHISISPESRKDILWWVEFLPTWNGVEVIQTETIHSIDIRLYTDASGVGLGGFYAGKWFAVPITNSFKYSICYWELLAIVVAVFSWGDEWHDKQVVLYTDNEAIVYIWSTCSCKCKDIMFLIRRLFFFIAKRNINLIILHIAGKSNSYADSLSRLQVDRFRARCPDAQDMPTIIPASIWSLLQNP